VDLFREERWPFIGGRGRGAGRPAWSGHGGHGRVPVATVAKARRGLALRHRGDVGSSVVQQGDEASSGEQWPEMGVRIISLLFFHVSRPWFGQGTQGTDRGEAGALLGGQGLGLGLPTTVANSCFDFV
jgi:hypothetical protein